MVQLNNVVEKIVPLDRNILLLIIGSILLYSSFKSIDNLMNNIFIILFILIIFDIFIKDNIKINIKNKYHKLIINNTLVILVIDLLYFIFKGDYKNIQFNYFASIAFSNIFYETVIFKLNNYNNLCTSRLRTISKITSRMATIHILSNFITNKPYDLNWFNFSFPQLLNIIILEIFFNENQFYNF
jgi:hypothetical protein